MGESRTELIAWVNDLTQLGISKIEQCGTGAVHCQIVDSIYRDVPLSKVKFNAKHEYEYVSNFKILQGAFDKHKIENSIPVERLQRCKFQDNLEFLQWMKKYWDQYYPGGTYDAVARRKGADIGAKPAAGTASTRSATSSTSNLKKTPSVPSVATSTNRLAAAAAASKRPAATSRAPAGMASSPSQWEAEKQELEQEYNRMVQDLTQQVLELKVTVEQVEKEREFYFGKLREIEVYVQQLLDNGSTAPPMSILQEIQGIMYKTEDGFEVPEGAEYEEETY
ncbi:calponin domain-containing protein [Polychytrium aggregatum]|uniref:calponin domain-containing protein n=1 Tax=Polychytrium aggregatum TaxID=110093 RepID=UPI0022FDE23C|nr:calponin domain-containing protein [Polychytrium aggregatum]KAI9207654.1 calponin homology domain-containing protein [Polychytrium aggregatum]